MALTLIKTIIMKNLTFCVLLISFIICQSSILSFAQKQHLNNKEFVYNAWLIHIDGETHKGHLVDVREERILFKKYNEKDAQYIDIEKVSEMKFRRKGSILKGSMIGAFSSLIVSVITAHIQGDDTERFLSNSPTTKSQIYATIFTIPAATIGGIIGDQRKKIPIHSKIDLGKLVKYTAKRP